MSYVKKNFFFFVKFNYPLRKAFSTYFFFMYINGIDFIQNNKKENVKITLTE